MFIKKLIRITIALSLFTILINCESGQKNQSENFYYNQSLNKKNVTQKDLSKDLDDVSTVSKGIKKEKGLLNIGLLLPLSGANYQIGVSLLNSAQLALEKTSNNNLIFHVADMGDPEKVLQNLYIILQNDIDLIIGPVFSNNIAKVKNILKENNLTAITLSNNSLMEDNNTFVFGLTLQDEINALLEYSNKNSLSKYVVILPDGTFGYTVKNEIDAFKSKNESKDFRFVYYNSQSPDFYAISKSVSRYEERKINLEKQIQLLEKLNTDVAKRELKRLKKLDTYGELDFDAILIFAEKFSDISNLSSILPYYDVDPKKIQYMSNSILAKDMALKEPGLDNAFFTSLEINNKKKFDEEYFSLFNHKPHKLSTLSYDIVGLISKMNAEEKNIKSIFDQKAEFIGINGWFKFSTNGKVYRKPDIYKINKERFIKIN